MPDLTLQQRFLSFCLMGMYAPVALGNPGVTVYEDGFNQYNGPLPIQYWLEGQARVGVENNRLVIDAIRRGRDTGATVWLDQKITGDVKVEFDAHVVDSINDVNNINFFLYFSDPNGDSLKDTRGERADGLYQRYGCDAAAKKDVCAGRELTGYILTYVAAGYPDSARFRFRQAPGFKLLSESRGFENRSERTYHISIKKKGSLIQQSVNGEIQLTYTIENYEEELNSGFVGFRTWNTQLWIDNFRIIQFGD